jgi:hypothetical protein
MKVGPFLHDLGEVENAAWKFDLAFIDGNHEVDWVRSDLALVAGLGIPWILLDDWWPFYGPGVQAAVRERSDLELEKQWGNMVLLRLRTD